MTAAIENQEVRVRGTVQGVGFRPTVFRLATDLQLNGEVFNDSDGVLIRLSGRHDNIQKFFQCLNREIPPLAKIDSIETSLIDKDWQYFDFSIRSSAQGQGRTEITADAASCSDCVDETLDSAQRRHLYPFTNCTHCGPRLSIVDKIPYDRSNTTMKTFLLCDLCQKEYSNPLDRRFHAQPIACPECGPNLWMYDSTISKENATGLKTPPGSEEILLQVAQALGKGNIIALKGIGGFHLCCDASNHKSVSLLRKRKQRYAKPLALMCQDLATIEQYCDVSALEKDVLSSSSAPIVLLNIRRSSSSPLSDAISPGSRLIGFMLPYTPLHHLICQNFGTPLVMTSGNLSGEPQIIDNSEALEKLGTIADFIVGHDRDIANRIDDSVVRCVSDKARIIRRSRGYAPRSIPLPKGFELADGILAYGAELKSTFCLLKNGSAILSQHQGDLEDLATYDDFENNLSLYRSLFEFEPRHIAFDLHPEYLSSKLAKAHANNQGLNAFGVQHHHAHIASAMVENNISIDHPHILGVALDGLGFGEKGDLWGGEFLLANYHSYQRLACLSSVAMPGAHKAIKQPWRNTFAHIVNSMSWDRFVNQYDDTKIARLLYEKPTSVLQQMMANQLNCPMASSTGRLFDAVAGALGIHADEVQFEGQASIELEMLADSAAILSGKVLAPYVFGIDQSSRLIRLDAANIWPCLLRDLQKKESRNTIATRFHAGLINGIVGIVDILKRQYPIADVALSGGCLQNAILLQGLEQALKQRRLNCLTHALVPANDGGIALGQAAVAAAKIIQDAKDIKKDIHQTLGERICV